MRRRLAPRPVHGASSRRAIARFCVIALAISAGSATHPSTVSAATTSPDSMVGVLSQPFTILSSTTGRFVVRVPSSVVMAPGARLEFQLHRRVSGRGPFRAIASGDVESAVVDSVSYPLARLSTIGAGVVAADVPFRTSTESASSITMRFAGVYPLTVRVTDAGGDVLARSMTFLNRRSSDDVGPMVQATVLARLSTEPSVRTDGLVEIQQDTRSAVRRFITFLDSAPDNVTVSVQPETVAALAASIEPIDVQLFGDLRTQLRQRTVMTAAFADTDPSLMAARGLGDEFIEQVRLGERTLDRHLPGVTIRRGMWLALRRLDSRGVGLLRDAGVNTVLFTGDAQDELPTSQPIDRVTAVSPDSGADMPVIAVDRLLAAHLSAPNAHPEQTAHRVVAEALVTRDEMLAGGTDPSRVRLVLGSPEGLLNDDASLLAVARILRSTPGFDPSDMSVGQSIAEGDPVISLPARLPRPSDGLTNTLRSLRARLDAVLSMVSESDPQRDSWRAMLGLATATSGSPKTYADALRSSLQSTLDAVTVTTPESINLSSRTGTVRFQVRNNSPHQLTVRVRLTSAKLDIDRRTLRVDLAPGTTTEVKFMATTRTNGRFPVVVRILTPEGNVDVVPSVTFTARVSALAGLGQLVSITFLLMLLAWWWSHRRRSTRAPQDSENLGAAGTVLSS